MKLKLGQVARHKDGKLILMVDKRGNDWGNTCLRTDDRGTWTVGEFKRMDKTAAMTFDDEFFIAMNFLDYYKQLKRL